MKLIEILRIEKKKKKWDKPQKNNKKLKLKYIQTKSESWN